jgi:hypothetical protein
MTSCDKNEPSLSDQLFWFRQTVNSGHTFGRHLIVFVERR